MTTTLSIMTGLHSFQFSKLLSSAVWSYHLERSQMLNIKKKESFKSIHVVKKKSLSTCARDSHLKYIIFNRKSLKCSKWGHSRRLNIVIFPWDTWALVCTLARGITRSTKGLWDSAHGLKSKQTWWREAYFLKLCFCQV